MDSEGDVARFRFSLRGLLLVTAFIAAMVAPVSWLGEMYVASLIFSLTMLALVSQALWRKKARSALLWCMLPAPLFLALYFSPTILMQMLLTALAILLTQGWLERPARRITVCIGVMIAVYGVALWNAADRYQRIMVLRDQYPVTSIEERLPTRRGTELISASLSVKQEERLHEIEEYVDPMRSRAGYRAGLLGMLHSDNATRFASATGFGVVRMRYLPVDNPKSFSAPPESSESLPHRFHSSESGSESTDELYRFSAIDFLSAERIGFVESTERVIGFVGHAFAHWPPDEASSRGGDRDRNRVSWRLDQLDLISLLLHEEPVAYVSDKLPNMEELRGAPTRPLDEFEAASLAKLRGASDLEVHEEEGPEGKRVRMVGALRAGKDCASCHDAPRGALLGAFSYDLTELVATKSSR